jgi:hypothetical protein
VTEPSPAPRTQVLCSAWATRGDLTDAQLALGTDEDWDRWLLVASEILYELSGRQWRGTGCTYTAALRGHPPEQGSGAWPYYRSWGMTRTSPAYWWFPLSLGGFWPVYRPTEPRPYAVKLPHDGVSAITSVTVGGVALDPSAYRLAAGSWLERTDGHSFAHWLDTLVIEYEYGRAPSASGVGAAIALAWELGKSEVGDSTCRLPKRVTSISRQGLSVAVIDSMDFFKIRKTGLADVDLWLTAVNPDGRKRRARVISPDIPRAR